MQNLDGSGMTARTGESIMAVFANAVTDAIYPEKIYLRLRSSAQLELRTGSVRLMNLKGHAAFVRMFLC